MRITVYRYAACPCGKVDLRTWPYMPKEQDCSACGTRLDVETGSEDFHAHVPYTARKRFSPHFNKAFGCKVESPEHLKHLQSVHGCEDADLARVDSQGWAESIPRDWMRVSDEARAGYAAAQAASDRSSDDRLHTDFVTDLSTHA